jgi:hypothetical protein
VEENKIILEEANNNRFNRLDVLNRCCSGPGGFKCSCCYDGPYAERKAIRAHRRIVRNALKVAVNDIGAFSDVRG